MKKFIIVLLICSFLFGVTMNKAKNEFGYEDGDIYTSDLRLSNVRVNNDFIQKYTKYDFNLQYEVETFIQNNYDEITKMIRSFWR